MILPALVALAPVLGFLGLLVYLDSYALVKPRVVLAAMAAGALLSGASYFANGWLLDATGLEFRSYSCFVAPFVEEALKALVIVALVRVHRIGFLVDAAIFGFAVGTGFALVENWVYLQRLPDAHIAVWVVRGFGTAIMHGGTTALMAVIALARLERSQGALRSWASALAGAAALHAAFNQARPTPVVAALGVMLLVPLLLMLAFARSEKALGQWLGAGFDADTAMIELIDSGNFAASPTGGYLLGLKRSFSGPMMVDALCYLRLHTELALRAKGLLMMRENGFPTPPADAAIRSRLDELTYLEGSLGASGLRALRPLLRMDRKTLWQVNLLKVA